MLEKIIIGVIIGFVSSAVLFNIDDENESPQNIIGVIVIVALVFIGSSFAYGAIYGLMAFGEIFMGFAIYAFIIGVKDEEMPVVASEKDETARVRIESEREYIAKVEQGIFGRTNYVLDHDESLSRATLANGIQAAEARLKSTREDIAKAKKGTVGYIMHTDFLAKHQADYEAIYWILKMGDEAIEKGDKNVFSKALSTLLTANTLNSDLVLPNQDGHKFLFEALTKAKQVCLDADALVLDVKKKQAEDIVQAKIHEQKLKAIRSISDDDVAILARKGNVTKNDILRVAKKYISTDVK